MKRSAPESTYETQKLANLTLTDTERLDALFTLFGGFYAFSPFFKIQEVMRDGRRGIDKLIADNPSLLGMKESEAGSVHSGG